MALALGVTSSRTGPIVSCVAIGELDLATVDDLRSAVLAAARHAETLRLDLSGVEFIDTTGLGTLLELQVALKGAGVAFQIATESACQAVSPQPSCCPLPPPLPRHVVAARGILERHPVRDEKRGAELAAHRRLAQRAPAVGLQVQRLLDAIVCVLGPGSVGLHSDALDAGVRSTPAG